VRKLAERAWFLLCLTLGRLLRSARYSRTQIGAEGELEVRKQRHFYAPVLVTLGAAMMRMLDTGVRILPQREWEERERELHQRLRGASIRIEPGGTLVMPRLRGETLATLLEHPMLDETERSRAIELSVVALADFHARGLTHGDAMAENVMVDLESGVAHWFDFESVHESSRPMEWRRADDVRALLATCVARTMPARLAETVRLIRDVYGDEDVTRLLAASFSSPMRRRLVFHLAQARLSYSRFREIARLSNVRSAGEPR
jgi:hypothetical protein